MWHAPVSVDLCYRCPGASEGKGSWGRRLSPPHGQMRPDLGPTERPSRSPTSPTAAGRVPNSDRTVVVFPRGGAHDETRGKAERLKLEAHFISSDPFAEAFGHRQINCGPILGARVALTQGVGDLSERPACPLTFALIPLI